MKNLSIKKLLYFVMSLVLLAGVVISLLVNFNLSSFIDKDKKESLSKQILIDFLHVRIDEKNYELYEDEKYIKAINNEIERLKRVSIKLKNSFDNPKNKEIVDSFVK